MAEIHDHSRADADAQLDRRPATWVRLRRAFGFAFQGLATAWTQQQNFRIESLIGVSTLALAAYLRTGFVTVTLCCVLVLTLELINSALEAVVDLAQPGYHPLAKTAKDLAAAAVLVTALGAALVGLVTLGPPLWARLFGA